MGFAAYLASYAARYPNFHVVGDVMPHWPDLFFGDEFSHLNPRGAALLSTGLGAWLSERRTTPVGVAPSPPPLSGA